MSIIKQYFQDYIRWFPDEWDWELCPGEENRELYMKFRARKCSRFHDNDKTPYFDSIEKDAGQFGRTHVVFTDIFGIKWEGNKGRHRMVGDADYEQHMYYWDEDDEYGEEDGRASVSDDVTAAEVPTGYAETSTRGIKHYIYMEGVVDMEYRFIVENHLFKDSYVILSYKDPITKGDEWSDSNDILRVWDIHGIAKGLKQFKPELYRKFLTQVDEHFKALQESDRDEEKSFAPTDKDGTFMTAEQYFERYFDSIEED